MVLPDAVVPGAIDAARCGVHPVIEDPPIARSEAAVVANAHGVHLAMNVLVLPLKARGLTNIELAIAEAVGNASLLVDLALGDGGLLCGMRGRLSDGEGRRRKERRHKCELRDSHGVFLLLWRR
jgi:hypothetical protein